MTMASHALVYLVPMQKAQIPKRVMWIVSLSLCPKKNSDNFFGTIDLLERILEKRVDLLTSKSLSPYMKERILGETEYVEL